MITHEVSGTRQSGPSFGYLTTWQHPSHGYLGGYLIVCAVGRPLEFHCTAPVLPSRAQEILYGPTLRPYLLGERIAARLLATARQRPSIVLTDQFDLNCQQFRYSFPIVVLIRSQQRPPPHAPRGEELRADGALFPIVSSDTCESAPASIDVTVAGHDFSLPSDHVPQRDECMRLLNLLSTSVDLAEPFERIELAIREAQRIGDDQPSEAVNDAA